MFRELTSLNRKYLSLCSVSAISHTESPRQAVQRFLPRLGFPPNLQEFLSLFFSFLLLLSFPE